MQGTQFAIPQKMSLGAAPKEGPLLIPVNVDFTATGAYQFDITGIQQANRISMLQTIFVDNSKSNVVFQIAVAPPTNQVVTVPPFSQAYIPLGFTNKLAATMLSQSGLIIPVVLMNVAMNAAVWSVNGTGTVTPGGALVVSDTILESTVNSGYLMTRNNNLASGGAVIPRYESTAAKTGTLAAGNQTIFTGAPGWQLISLQVYAAPNAVLAAAGIVTVTASESGGATFATGIGFLPTAAPTGLTAPVQILNLASDYTSKIAASNMVINLSAAPSSGTIYYNAQYALTSFVGG